MEVITDLGSCKHSYVVEVKNKTLLSFFQKHCFSECFVSSACFFFGLWSLCDITCMCEWQRWLKLKNKQCLPKSFLLA